MNHSWTLFFGIVACSSLSGFAEQTEQKNACPVSQGKACEMLAKKDTASPVSPDKSTQAQSNNAGKADEAFAYSDDDSEVEMDDSDNDF